MFKRSDNPTWRFAPNLGGAEYGNNAAQAHFANDALSKMVREILQNSLDSPDDGLKTVEVTFRPFEIDPQDIRADLLKEHVGAALQQVEDDQDPQSVTQYRKMMDVLSQPKITCLAITDAGTTGLRDKNWENLIFREGTPANTPGESKGGSFGFGKNAPFNLSECNTVIYSTKYIGKAKKGVIKHMTGRSQLVSHDNPQRAGERSQAVGFLAIHERDTSNIPIEGPKIPESFRLKETGTGVFVIGFNTRRRNWAKEIAETTVTQFFPAIQTGKLTVTIQDDLPNPSSILINKTTLQTEIERLPERSPTRHYHAAITQDHPVLTEPTGLLSKDGVPKRLQLWVSTNKDAPHRLAHINRRGMLITEARQFSSNPFHPEGGTAWNGWAAVTMAENDQTDDFLRRMEPPAHDGVHYARLRDPNQQDEAKLELRHHRAQIAQIIKARVNDHLTQDSENLTELADLFPDDLGGNANDHHIKTREIQHKDNSDISHPDPNEEPDDYQDEDQTDITTPTKDNDSKSRTGGRREDEPQNPPVPEVSIQNVRVIRTAPDELTISLTMPNTKAGSIEFEIRTAGEQYQRNEECVPIREIAPIQDMLVQAHLNQNAVKLSAPANNQVLLALKLQGQDQPYRSYAVIKTQEPEFAEI